MNSNPIVYIVHCIDTEGPLKENINDTFKRINSVFNKDFKPSKKLLIDLQQCKININQKKEIADMISPNLLQYNTSWKKINNMLDVCLSKKFRNELIDDFEQGWIFSWHCMDHIFYKTNPRKKALGYGKVFNFYKEKLNATKSFQDELNWHFHPVSINNSPMACATSYENSFFKLHYILSRRILDNSWFPVVNRQGFNSTRPDSNLFLEQWIPFDYSNMSTAKDNNQPDLNKGRFGDWRQAPLKWDFYNPSIDNYQVPGNCKRSIFRCLNIGTRFNNIDIKEIESAFKYADKNNYAVLAITNHDYRDIIKDINKFRSMLLLVKKKYPNIKFKFSGAEKAAVECQGKKVTNIKFKSSIVNNKYIVELLEGKIFGPQPYLAIKTKTGNYHHDNLDIQRKDKIWTYTMDDQTIMKSKIKKIGVGSAGINGGYNTDILDLN